jgi:hypothetical protein
MLTKMAKMPTYTWNKALEVNSRHRIEDITSACLLRIQSLDSRELQSDAIALQRTCERIDKLTVNSGLSIYGGNDVQPPSTAAITASLRLGKTPVDSVSTGHGGLRDNWET